MILVDSSVWIDYFNGKSRSEGDRLHELLGEQPLAIGDLILGEVIQGFRSKRAYLTGLALLSSLDCFDMVGREVAVRAAENYRFLRARGITVRKTIDTLIATYCLVADFPLLYSDRDFDHFVEHLGLRSALV